MMASASASPLGGVQKARLIQIGSEWLGLGLPCQPILGPCTADIHVGELFRRLADHGITMTRAGWWKPRSGADSFPGHGSTGGRWVLDAARDYGMEVVFVEVMDTSHLDAVRRVRDDSGFDGTIVCWVGARTKNQPLLRALGDQTEFPVMLKHGLADAGVEVVLNDLEFVTRGTQRWDDSGNLILDDSTPKNDNILLCVRGLEKPVHSDTPHRFDSNPDWIGKLQKHRPVVLDPSHIAGKTRFVWPVLEEGLAHRPSAVMIEVHFGPGDPKRRVALCDAAQAVPIDEVPRILEMLAQHNA